MKHFLVLFLLVWTSFLGAVEPEADLATKKELDDLASKALTEAVKVVNKSGGFYPFAMVMTPDRSVQLIGYRGTQESKPPAEEYVKDLYWQIVRFLESYTGYTSAIMVKPHVVVDESGAAVPGVWALMDHRAREPVVGFLPFEKRDDGSWSLGSIVFSAAESVLFRDASENEKNE